MELDLQPIESNETELDLQPLDLQPVEPNRFAKPDGTPFTPADFQDPMTFMERLGKNFSQQTDAFGRLVTGESEGVLDAVAGAFAPLGILTAPLGTSVEHPVASITGNETAGEIAGMVAEAAGPMGLARLAQLGKVNELGAGLAKVFGADFGSLAGQPGAQKFIREAGPEMAADAHAMRELPAVVRETVLDPQAMQRSSSLLDAAQATVVPGPGNITAGAAMEAGQGQVGRLIPTADDAFRTTQESIERATGGPGQATAEALRAERDDLARQILQQAEIDKNAREMAAVEAMVGGPRAPRPSVLTGAGEVGIDQKLVEQFLLTGDEKPLLEAARRSPIAEKLGANLLGKDAALIAEQGGKAGKPLSGAGSVFRGLWQESTRELARFGAAGRVLAKEMVVATDKGEREGGAAVTMVQKLVKGMTTTEKESLVDFLDQGATPINQRVQEAGLQLKAMLGDVAGRATQADMTLKNIMTGEVIPWAPKPDGNYFPHFNKIDFEELYANRKKRAETVAEIAADQGIPLEAARRQLDFMMKNAERRFGNLEMSRVMNWKQWDRDPERVLSRYFAGAYKRLNLAEQFGSDYKRAYALVELVGTQANDMARGMAKTYVDRILGKEELSHFEEGFGGIRRVITNWQVVTKLGGAVLANASQPVLIAVTAGLRPTVKAINEMLFRNGTEFAGMAGATLDATMGQIQRELGSGSLGGEVLRRTGFTAVERFNRILSANAGKIHAEDTFKKLMDALDSGSSRAGFYKEQLGKLGIDPAEAIGRGSLSLDDLYKAGQSMTKRTQFKTGVQDLPLHRSTELGRLVFQFGSFTFKAAQMFKDEIIIEAGRGNVAPLARALLLMPLGGELVNSAQSLVYGKTRPESLVERIADDFAAVGSFAVLYSALKATQFGPAGVTGVMFGPTASDAVRGASNLGSAWQGNTNPLEKQALASVPVAGPPLANRIYPSAEERRRRRQ